MESEITSLSLAITTYLICLYPNAATMGEGNRYNYVIVFFAALGSFTYGYNSGIIGSVLGLASFFDYFNIDLSGPNAAYGNRIVGGLSQSLQTVFWTVIADNVQQQQMASSPAAE